MAFARRGHERYGDGEEYELGSAEPLYDPEAQAKIVEWRTSELERCGCTPAHALALAMRRDVDLHRACGMLRAGATPEQVALILL